MALRSRDKRGGAAGRAPPPRAHVPRQPAWRAQGFGEVWTDEQINDMIYHRKADGSFTVHDLRAILSGVETPESRPPTANRKP